MRSRSAALDASDGEGQPPSAWAWSGRWWQVEALEADIQREKRLLMAHGVVEDDVVAVSGQNHPHTVTIVLTALAMGAHVYPTPPSEGPPSLDALRSLDVRVAVHVGTAPASLPMPANPEETCVSILSRRPRAGLRALLRDARIIEPWTQWPLSRAQQHLPPRGRHRAGRHVLEPGAFARDVRFPLAAGLYLDFSPNMPAPTLT